MAYWLYNLLLSLALLASLPVLPLFFLMGRRFRAGFWQRFGYYPRLTCQAMQGSRPIWIHAVSVGEVLSAGALAGELKQKFPRRKILVSTFTTTGNEIARQTLGADGVILFPLDHPWMVRRALDIFDPSLLIFLETEIWPNFLRAAHRKGIPALLLSGRLSPRGFRRYFFFRSFFSSVVRQFAAAGMQSEDDAERMIRLGFDRQKVAVTGSLKRAVSVGGHAGGGRPDAWGRLLGAKGSHQVLVAGSTHRGEEEMLLDVFVFLKARFPALLMVLAPRHPQRFSEVERLLQKKKLEYEKKSGMNGRKDGDVGVIFLDTLGDLPGFYALADIAFVGGSLVDAGGHNPMEPARFCKPILFGPYMTNFSDVAGEMKRKGGGIEVSGREDLVREISALLTDRAKADRMGQIAYGVVEGDQGVVERSIGLVCRYLHP